MTDRPTHTDVLLGRGVASNRHQGNENFRAIVSQHVDTYVVSTKKQKMTISRSIVKKVQTELEPPGRFLKRCTETGLWNEVEDKRALEKTAQALRDGAAPLRKKPSDDIYDSAFLESLFEGSKSGGKGSSAPDDNNVMPKPKKQGGRNISLSFGGSSRDMPRPKKQRSHPNIASGLDSSIADIDIDNLFDPLPSQVQRQSNYNWELPIDQSIQPQQPEHMPPQPMFQAPLALSQDDQSPTMPQSQQLSCATMSIFGSARSQQVHTGNSLASSNDQQSSLAEFFNSTLFRNLDAPSSAPSFSVSTQPNDSTTTIQPDSTRRYSTSKFGCNSFNLGECSRPNGNDDKEILPMTTSMNTSLETTHSSIIGLSQPHSQSNHQHHHHHQHQQASSQNEQNSFSVTTTNEDFLKMAALDDDSTGKTSVAGSQNLPDQDQDQEEFAREMGPDEYFLGLCNSDPIGDGGFDGYGTLFDQG